MWYSIVIKDKETEDITLAIFGVNIIGVYQIHRLISALFDHIAWLKAEYVTRFNIKPCFSDLLTFQNGRI